jgi:hypothetical protein
MIDRVQGHVLIRKAIQTKIFLYTINQISISLILLKRMMKDKWIIKHNLNKNYL